MHKYKISYDQYDRLCELTSEVHCNLNGWLPTETEINCMVIAGIQYFIGFFAWILEHSTPTTEDEKKAYKLLNNTVQKEIEFTEEEQKLNEKVLTTQEYEKIVFAIDNVRFIPEPYLMTDSEFALFTDNIEYFIGFSFILINKMKINKKSKITTDVLKNYIKNNYEYIQQKWPVELTYEEYDALCENVRNSSIQCDDYLPTNEDIITIIEPNFKQCFDFVLWILETTNKSKSDEGKDIRIKLRKMIMENVHFKEGRDVVWL